MALAEQIFINKQFLNDLDSICNITVAEVALSQWGQNADEVLENITDLSYITNNLLDTNHQHTDPFIADTFIEDDLVCFSIPTSFPINSYYSLIIYYTKDDSDERTIACIMYTQNTHHPSVLSLVNYADNRIYLDLRSLPLKAHFLTHMSPYEQLLEASHAPAYHKHKTFPSNITPAPNSTDYSTSSRLPNAYTDSLAVVSAIAANSELTTDPTSTTRINEDGAIVSKYLPSIDIDMVKFFSNTVGCAYEWANSRLCTEDLVDANNIITLADISENI